MKALLMSVLLVLSAKALAANELTLEDTTSAKITTSTSDLNFSTDDVKYNSIEGGFQFSSINNGSSYAHIAMIHQFKNGFAMGARGLMPLNYGDDLQIYQGQLFGRFMLLNEVTQMNLEPVVTQALVSNDEGTKPFAMLGMGFGISRTVQKDIILGAQVGVDYGSARVSHDQIAESTKSLYSHFNLTGSYWF